MTREEAIEQLKWYFECDDGMASEPITKQAYKMAIEALKEDVEPVKHGKWEQNSFAKRIYYCSECGRPIEDGTKKPQEHFPYCHCGAKMEEKQ